MEQMAGKKKKKMAVARENAEPREMRRLVRGEESTTSEAVWVGKRTSQEILPKTKGSERFSHFRSHGDFLLLLLLSNKVKR